MKYLLVLLKLLSGPLISSWITMEAAAQTHYQHNVVWGRLTLTDTITQKLR